MTLNYLHITKIGKTPISCNSNFIFIRKSNLGDTNIGMASIIGIVAGVIVLIAIIAIVAVLVVKKKRKDGKSPSHKVGAQL